MGSKPSRRLARKVHGALEWTAAKLHSAHGVHYWDLGRLGESVEVLHPGAGL